MMMIKIMLDGMQSIRCRERFCSSHTHMHTYI